MQNFYKIEVTGADVTLFSKLRGKIVEAVLNLLNTTIDHDRGYTVTETVQHLTSKSVGFLEAKLDRAGIENQLLLAEIEEKLANARKTNAEAESKSLENRKARFEQALKELKYAVNLAKALVPDKEDPDYIIFTKDITPFINLFTEIDSSHLLE